MLLKALCPEGVFVRAFSWDPIKGVSEKELQTAQRLLAQRAHLAPSIRKPLCSHSPRAANRLAMMHEDAAPPRSLWPAVGLKGTMTLFNA